MRHTPRPLDEQQAQLVERLRAAGGAPVSFAELRAIGIENPALLSYELAAVGLPVTRTSSPGDGMQGLSVRLEPERELQGSAPEPSRSPGAIDSEVLPMPRLPPRPHGVRAAEWARWSSGVFERLRALQKPLGNAAARAVGGLASVAPRLQRLARRAPHAAHDARPAALVSIAAMALTLVAVVAIVLGNQAGEQAAGVRTGELRGHRGTAISAGSRRTVKAGSATTALRARVQRRRRIWARRRADADLSRRRGSARGARSSAARRRKLSQGHRPPVGGDPGERAIARRLHRAQQRSLPDLRLRAL